MTGQDRHGCTESTSEVGDFDVGCADVNGHHRDAGGSARKPEREGGRQVADRQDHQVVLSEPEPFERTSVLEAGGQHVLRGEARVREREMDQASFRRVTVDPPEPFDDLAQLRLLPVRKFPPAGSRGPRPVRARPG